MRIWNEYVTLQTKNKREFINITPQVKAALEKSGIRDGIILVSAMHVNCAVYVNQDEPGLNQDIEEWLDKLAPFREDYNHGRGHESNAGAHLQNLLLHHQVVVPVADGKLDFGPWQQIFYAELDGQRPKRLLIKIIGE